MKIGKLKLYLETTVFNYYFDEDRTGHEDVLRLFEAIRAEKYEAYTSRYVTEELERAQEPKKSKMLNLIEKYEIILLPFDEEAVRLSNLYIENNIIPVSYRYDSTHIAIASVYGLDCIVSYNFKHINRDKTKKLTTTINQEEGYEEIIICTAEEVLNKNERENIW